MGMFDSFHHPCRACGAEVEWQSKAGECRLRDYRLISNPPPPDVAQVNKKLQQRWLLSACLRI
jgi:hypothetical protein